MQHKPTKEIEEIVMSRFTQLILAVIMVALVCARPDRECSGGPHDHWTDCGSQCPATCENPNPGPCILSCKTDTCACDNGYVRDSNGQCVRPEDCYSDC